jgi:hypothetical protein
MTKDRVKIKACKIRRVKQLSFVKLAIPSRLTFQMMPQFSVLTGVTMHQTMRSHLIRLKLPALQRPRPCGIYVEPSGQTSRQSRFKISAPPQSNGHLVNFN